MTAETRKHICPYCGEMLDTADELKGHVFQMHKGRGLPIPEGWIRLTVNGCEYNLKVEPNWTLNYLVHEVLGLTGSKRFCDQGACGACTMIVDGRPVLSCMMLAIECDRKAVQTVEGIAAEGHPLIEAYTNHHAMQCGYCTPGFVVTSKALLDRVPDPTDDQIIEALAGNICRCGTYQQHIIAIKEAAAKILVRKNAGKEET